MYPISGQKGKGLVTGKSLASTFPAAGDNPSRTFMHQQSTWGNNGHRFDAVRQQELHLDKVRLKIHCISSKVCAISLWSILSFSTWRNQESRVKPSFKSLRWWRKMEKEMITVLVVDRVAEVGRVGQSFSNWTGRKITEYLWRSLPPVTFRKVSPTSWSLLTSQSLSQPQPSCLTCLHMPWIQGHVMARSPVVVHDNPLTEKPNLPSSHGCQRWCWFKVWYTWYN